MAQEIVGASAHGQPDGNEAPVKIGGVARTAPPTAVNNSARVNESLDIYGRPLGNVYYLRNITTTANATLTRLSETTVMAGNSSNFLDMITITAVNATGVASRVDIRSGTAGTIYDSIFMAANSSATKNYAPFLAQSEIGQSWTAQVTNLSGDISDNFVTVTIVAINNPGV